MTPHDRPGPTSAAPAAGNVAMRTQSRRGLSAPERVGRMSAALRNLYFFRAAFSALWVTLVSTDDPRPIRAPRSAFSPDYCSSPTQPPT
jgi:hypothetical protein